MKTEFEDGDVIRTKENKAFRVDAQLGAGGMSEVYRVLDHSMSRPVVFKLLARRALVHVGRFVQEAKLLANVSSPYVARVYERGETVDGLPYYTMEWLKAWSLREVLLSRAVKKEFGFRWNVALKMMMDIVSGLAALHEAGIVHRDMKPENVLLASEHGKQVLKIIDPGIAKLFDDDSVEGLVGTPLYAAPEQLVDETTVPSPASDVFAAGLLFYELLTGQHAYAIYGHNLAAAMERRNKPIPPLTLLRPNVPPALEELAFRMTALSPADRPSAVEILDALERIGLAGDGAEQWTRGRRQIITESGLRPQAEATKQGRITRADLEAPTDPDGADVAPHVRYMQMLAEQGAALGYEPVAYVQKMTGGVPPEELDHRLVVGLAETSPGGEVPAHKQVTVPGLVIAPVYVTYATGQGDGAPEPKAPELPLVDREAATRSAPDVMIHAKTPIMGEDSHRRAMEVIVPSKPGGKGGTVPMRPGFGPVAAGGSGVLHEQVNTLPSTAGSQERVSRTPPPVRVDTPPPVSGKTPIPASGSRVKPTELTEIPASTAAGSRIRVAGAPVSSRKTPVPVPTTLAERVRAEELRDRRRMLVAVAVSVVLFLAIAATSILAIDGGRFLRGAP